MRARLPGAGAAPAVHVPRRAAIGVAIVLVAQLMLILDTTIINVALPQLNARLGLSATSLALVVNGYGLAFGRFLLVGGRLSDVYGRVQVRTG